MIIYTETKAGVRNWFYVDSQEAATRFVEAIKDDDIFVDVVAYDNNLMK